VLAELEPEVHPPGDDTEKEVSGEDWGDEVQDVSALRPVEGSPCIYEDTRDVEVGVCGRKFHKEQEEGYSPMKIDKSASENDKHDKSASKQRTTSLLLSKEMRKPRRSRKTRRSFRHPTQVQWMRSRRKCR
jgi:hypothetical protein